MTRHEARIKAREYAALQLERQDSPDWARENGVPDELDGAFMDELQRIADRIRRTIPAANQ